MFVCDLLHFEQLNVNNISVFAFLTVMHRGGAHVLRLMA